MPTRHATTLFILLLLLPLIVAGFGWSFITALILLLLWLAARWVLTLKSLQPVQHQAGLILDSIPISHFTEKVRWCLDKAEISYTERKSGGTLGAFFTGRTVPRLWVRSGLVWSSIGNSDEILRFLWGQFAYRDAQKYAFLKPTSETIELEQQLGVYGRDIQVWIYHHILPNRQLTLKAWGVHDPEIPAFHKLLLQTLFPVLRLLIRRAFAITPARVSKSKKRIERVLEGIDARLRDNSYLVGTDRTYVDYTFAALSGLWVQAPNYANGKAAYTAASTEEMPGAMVEDIHTWRTKFAHATHFVENLYAQERVNT